MRIAIPLPIHADAATGFSLFHTQKLLDRSTLAVTSAYYASLTDLPHLQHSRMGKSS